MKRFLLVVLVAAVAALAISYGLRGSRQSASGIVASLLPQNTIALALLPDFERTRNEWRLTDIYQLWREPDVQEFLKRPRANVPAASDIARLVEDARQIRMKDGFIALTAWEGADQKIAGGFRFNGTADDAEKIVGKWRGGLGGDTAAAGSPSEYNGHRIQISGDRVSAYVRDWFLAANDLPTLQLIVDRLDGRAKTDDANLASDATFVAARKPMPQNYETLVYARLDRLIQKVYIPGGSNIARDDQATPVQAVCVATAFDGGKMRDTAFVAGSTGAVATELTRAALAIATKETFLYVAARVNPASQLDANNSTANRAAMNLLSFVTSLAASRITSEDWNAAFGSEVELVGDWRADSRLPALLATIPVKDAEQARKIIAQILAANADSTWSEAEKEGAHYFTRESDAGLFSLSPTIGISDRSLLIGADAGSVEDALKRLATGGKGLGAIPDFRKAEHMVGAAKQSFAYIDPALLYRRLDSALRPMLVMGAAFLPHIGDAVDLSKLPAPEVITKHLSPIVLSAHPVEGGYVSESVGPITAYQALIGVAGLGTFAKAFYQNQLNGRRSGVRGSFPVFPVPHPAATATASPAATATPNP